MTVPSMAHVCQAEAWLLRQGLGVFKNIEYHGPVDLIAMNQVTGECILIDVKGNGRTGDEGGMGGQRTTPEQEKLGVKLLVVNTATGDCYWYKKRQEIETAQLAIDWDAQARIDAQCQS